MLSGAGRTVLRRRLYNRISLESRTIEMRKCLLIAVCLWLLAGCGAGRRPGGDLEATWGLDRIDAASADKQNLVLPILKCSLDGFTEDVSEYRAWAVKRSAPNGRITATVPSAGTY